MNDQDYEKLYAQASAKPTLSDEDYTKLYAAASKPSISADPDGKFTQYAKDFRSGAAGIVSSGAAAAGQYGIANKINEWAAPSLDMQKGDEESEARSKAVENGSFLDQAGTVAGNFVKNLGHNAAHMAGGLVAPAALSLVAPEAVPFMFAGQSAGDAKLAIYNRNKQAYLAKGNMSEADADKQATTDAEYTGKNAVGIGASTAIGFGAGMFGTGGQIANIGKGLKDKALAEATAQRVAGRSLAVNTAEEGAVQGAVGGAQNVAGSYASNQAADNANLDTPRESYLTSFLKGGVSGAALGSAFGAGHKLLAKLPESVKDKMTPEQQDAELASDRVQEPGQEAKPAQVDPQEQVPASGQDPSEIARDARVAGKAAAFREQDEDAYMYPKTMAEHQDLSSAAPTAIDAIQNKVVPLGDGVGSNVFSKITPDAQLEVAGKTDKDTLLADQSTVTQDHANSMNEGQKQAFLDDQKAQEKIARDAEKASLKAAQKVVDDRQTAMNGSVMGQALHGIKTSDMGMLQGATGSGSIDQGSVKSLLIKASKERNTDAIDHLVSFDKSQGLEDSKAAAKTVSVGQGMDNAQPIHDAIAKLHDGQPDDVTMTSKEIKERDDKAAAAQALADKPVKTKAVKGGKKQSEAEPVVEAKPVDHTQLAFDAIKNGDEAGAIDAVKNGADLSAPIRDGNGRYPTLVHEASAKGMVNLLKAIESKDPGHTALNVDQNGNHALTYARDAGTARHIMSVDDTAVHAKNHNDSTPLHQAQSSEVAREMLSHGADISAVNKDGFTPEQSHGHYENPGMVEAIKPYRIAKEEAASLQEHIATPEEAPAPRKVRRLELGDSQGEAASGPTHSKEELTGRIKDVLNNKAKGLGDAITKSDLFKVIDRESSKTDKGTHGYVESDGSVGVVHDNIPKSWSDEQVYGLLKHEIGVHAVLSAGGKEKMAELLSHFQKLVESGDKDAKAAMDRVPKGTAAEHVMEEGLAYYVQHAKDPSVMARIGIAMKQMVRSITKGMGISEKGAFMKWVNGMSGKELNKMAGDAIKEFGNQKKMESGQSESFANRRESRADDNDLEKVQSLYQGFSDEQGRQDRADGKFDTKSLDKLFKKLAQRGVDLNSYEFGGTKSGMFKGSGRKTLMEIAADESSSHMLNDLLARRLKPSGPSDAYTGSSPLSVAIKAGHVENAEALIKAGAATHNTHGGPSALHDAASHGSKEITQALLDSGVDTKPQRRDGRTPMDLASDGKIADMILNERNRRESVAEKAALNQHLDAPAEDAPAPVRKARRLSKEDDKPMSPRDEMLKNRGMAYGEKEKVKFMDHVHGNSQSSLEFSRRYLDQYVDLDRLIQKDKLVLGDKFNKELDPTHARLTESNKAGRSLERMNKEILEPILQHLAENKLDPKVVDANWAGIHHGNKVEGSSYATVAESTKTLGFAMRGKTDAEGFKEVRLTRDKVGKAAELYDKTKPGRNGKVDVADRMKQYNDYMEKHGLKEAEVKEVWNAVVSEESRNRSSLSSRDEAKQALGFDKSNMTKEQALSKLGDTNPKMAEAMRMLEKIKEDTSRVYDEAGITKVDTRSAKNTMADMVLAAHRARSEVADNNLKLAIAKYFESEHKDGNLMHTEKVSDTDSTKETGNHIVSYTENGVERQMVFDKDNLNMMGLGKGLNHQEKMDDWAISQAGKITRFVSNVHTHWAPFFFIKHGIRNMIHGAIAAGYDKRLEGKWMDVVKHAIGSSKMIFDAAMGKDMTKYGKEWDVYSGFRDMGGEAIFALSPKSASETASEINSKLYPTANRKAWVKVTGGYLHLVHSLTHMAENNVRFALYKTALENGIPAKEGINLSRNATVNFNTRGTNTGTASKLYGFFNANIQGTASLGRIMFDRDVNGKLSLNKKGKQVLFGGILVGFAAGMEQHAAGIKPGAVSESELDENLVIGVDGKAVKVPLALGLNVPFALGRIIAEGVHEGHPMDRIANAVNALMKGFLPVGSSGLTAANTYAPTPIDGIISLAANQSGLGDSSIRKEANNNTPTTGSSRNKENDSMLAKGIAAIINVATGGSEYKPGHLSPTSSDIDFLLNQYAPIPWSMINKAIDGVKGLMDGKPMSISDIPVVSQYVKDTEGRQATQSIYIGHEKEMNTYLAGISQMEKKPGSNIGEYKRDNMELARAVDLYRDTNKDIQAIHKQVAQLKVMIDLPATSSEAQANAKKTIFALQEKVTSEQKNFNERMEKIKESTKR